MAKNTNTGANSSENLTNHESEKTSGRKIPKQKPENRETPNDRLQHESGRKVWHYFFEFLMVFLAVFAGFIAENWRGQLQEHQRENVFIRSIVEDLKSDTLQSGKVLMQLRRTSTGIDSVLNALSSPGISENSNNAYRLWTKNLDIRAFVSNDRTIQQLKNSGELRLIRNKAVSDGIMKYDQTVRNYYQQSNFMYGALSNQKIYMQLFDFISLKKNQHVPVPLTEQGKKLLNQAYAHLQLWNYGLMGLISWLDGVHEEGKTLLAFIQKEYHVK
ncbi:MAG: hypothetical protein IH595_02750 [Bacteroidales bacterium]|nr:hypothetical protein [Bacteroidales bacterium]